MKKTQVNNGLCSTCMEMKKLRGKGRKGYVWKGNREGGEREGEGWCQKGSSSGRVEALRLANCKEEKIMCNTGRSLGGVWKEW